MSGLPAYAPPRQDGGRPHVGWRAWAERRWVVAALYAVLVAAALYPVFSVTVPPLVDYPNHLARMHILAHRDAIPALQRIYTIEWSLHPNMAMDLIVPVLARFMSIYMAGKLFVAASMLSVLGGTLALRKVLFGRIGLWPVLTFLLLYNHALYWGFLNYLFTAGLGLAAFAAWIALRDRACLFRIALFSAIAFALYVGHLFGLFVYGSLVLGYETWRTRGNARPVARHIRDWMETGVQFAVPAVLFLIWTMGNLSLEGAMTAFGSLGDRFSVLFAPVNFGLLAIDLPALVLLAAVYLLCRSDDSVHLAPAVKLPLLLVAIAALVMPAYLSGVWGTHLRLPLIVGCLLIAGTRIDETAWRPMPYVAAAALVLILCRVAMIAGEWRETDSRFTEFRRASSVLAPGALLLPAMDEQAAFPGTSPQYPMQFWHVASLAVIERSAFVPTLFTGHTAVDVAPALKPFDTPVGTPVSPKMLAAGADPATSSIPLGYRFERYVRAYWIGWPETFDYLFIIHFAQRGVDDPKRLRRLVAGSYFDIDEIRRSHNAGRPVVDGH